MHDIKISFLSSTCLTRTTLYYSERVGYINLLLHGAVIAFFSYHNTNFTSKLPNLFQTLHSTYFISYIVPKQDRGVLVSLMKFSLSFKHFVKTSSMNKNEYLKLFDVQDKITACDGIQYNPRLLCHSSLLPLNEFT